MDELFDKLTNPNFNIDINRVMIEIFKINELNNEYLRLILKYQLEIKDSIKSKYSNDLDDEFYDKLHQIENLLVEKVNKTLHKKISDYLVD